ncbi:hypothetical protein, partial [Microvirga tunisiensis]|uniref:hypothetical protein n=1 Tax=Microvirga tunisiensis TaxID=2108360 RepID=UPI001AED2C52
GPAPAALVPGQMGCAPCGWSIDGHRRANSATAMMPRSGSSPPPLRWLGCIGADPAPDPKRPNPHR